MRIYSVHLKQDKCIKKDDLDSNLVLIREGFCWPAFFFLGVWALWHRMWLWGGVLILLNILISLSFYYFLVERPYDLIFLLGFSVVIGIVGNDLRRSSLTYKGYKNFGIVAAKNIINAEKRFLTNNPFWVSIFSS